MRPNTLRDRPSSCGHRNRQLPQAYSVAFLRIKTSLSKMPSSVFPRKHVLSAVERRGIQELLKSSGFRLALAIASLAGMTTRLLFGIRYTTRDNKIRSCAGVKLQPAN